MGTNKEVFDAELSAIAEALEVTVRGEPGARERVAQEVTLPWTKVQMRTDSQAAIACLQHTALESGQWLSRLVIARAQRLANREKEVDVHWVPGHVGVKGYKRGDRTVKVAAVVMYARRYKEQFISLTHIYQTITERE